MHVMPRYVLASLALVFPYPQVREKQQFSLLSYRNSLRRDRPKPLGP